MPHVVLEKSTVICLACCKFPMPPHLTFLPGAGTGIAEPASAGIAGDFIESDPSMYALMLGSSCHPLSVRNSRANSGSSMPATAMNVCTISMRSALRFSMVLAPYGLAVRSSYSLAASVSSAARCSRRCAATSARARAKRCTIQRLTRAKRARPGKPGRGLRRRQGCAGRPVTSPSRGRFRGRIARRGSNRQHALAL